MVIEWGLLPDYKNETPREGHDGNPHGCTGESASTHPNEGLFVGLGLNRPNSVMQIILVGSLSSNLSLPIWKLYRHGSSRLIFLATLVLRGVVRYYNY